MLNLAKLKAKKSKVKIDFRKGDITEFHCGKKFDVIISMLVLDHIKDLEKVIDVVHNSSKIGTKFIVSNIHPYWTYLSYVKNDSKTLINNKNKTDQYNHNLAEYLFLLRKKGFKLIGYEDVIFEEKYAKLKKFTKFSDKINTPISVIYIFKKQK
jgi:2-polyprenyl-3-methyl-5-hydroxy-6-metoxy-1,4-benzoquinol methylase